MRSVKFWAVVVLGVVLCDGGRGWAAEGVKAEAKEEVGGKREFKECFEKELKRVRAEGQSRNLGGFDSGPVEWLAEDADKVLDASRVIDVEALKKWGKMDDGENPYRERLAWCVIARGAVRDWACRELLERGIRNEEYYSGIWQALAYLPVKMQRELLIPMNPADESLRKWRYPEKLALLGMVGDAECLERLKCLQKEKAISDHHEPLEKAIRALEVKLARNEKEQVEWERIGTLYWKAWVDVSPYNGGQDWMAGNLLSEAKVRCPAPFLNVRIENGDSLATTVALNQEEEGCLDLLNRKANAAGDQGGDVPARLMLMKNVKARKLAIDFFTNHPKALLNVKDMLAKRGNEETVQILKGFLKVEQFAGQRELIGEIAGRIQERMTQQRSGKR
jgi:hypothetical protein